MEDRKITTMKEAQELVKYFAQRNGWNDEPTVDKFDHLHEELIEMSRLLRYKSSEQRKQIIEEKRPEFEDGIGDLFFALCRLANQLGVDIESSFNMVKTEILKKYPGGDIEHKIIKE